VIARAALNALVFILGIQLRLCAGAAPADVTLTWDPSPDAVAGYNVYCQNEETQQWTVSDIGNTTSAILENLQPGEASNEVEYAVPAFTSRFVEANTMTGGDWEGVYGSAGNWLAGAFPMLPNYATINCEARQWIWTENVSGGAAPQLAGETTERIAACWYSPGDLVFDIRITDGQAHRLTMYFLDWSYSGREQAVDLIDGQTGAVLDSRTLSDFTTGIYLTWEVSGAVVVRVTPHNVNAVVSGIFLDADSPPVAARFVESDTTTGGNWMTKYGQEGSFVARDDLQRPPAYGTCNIHQSSEWTYWTDGHDDRALVNNAGTARIPGVWFSYYPTTNSFYIDITMNDGAAHEVAIYALDWYREGRTLQIDVMNALTDEILDSRQLLSYVTGTYLVWDVKGSVRLRVSTLAGPNALVSGVFFGPASAPL
jgi:hypothetical protein